MKTNAIIRIALCTLGILILSAILFVGVFYQRFSFEFSFQESVHHNDSLSSDAYITDPSQIQNIQIEWAAGNITIEPNDDAEYIRVMESECEEKYRMICKESGNTLTIQFCKSSNNVISFGTSIDAKDLVIQVPSDWICRNLEIDVAAADVDIANMTISTLSFDGASGMCNLENCSVSELDVDVASGDLTFSGVLDTLDFDGASADCTLILSECPSHIDLDGMSGELDITLPSDCGFTVTAEGLSSSFSTDFQTISRNGSHIHGDGHCKIEVDAMSGSVAIHNGGENCRGDHSSGSHHSRRY